MISLTNGLLFFSGGSFLIYGISCLVSVKMREEFSRFGLARFRALVGWLEVMGGLAQIAHMVAPSLALLATAGVFVLMLLGVITRIKIGDNLLVTFPALGFMILNGWLFYIMFPW